MGYFCLTRSVGKDMVGGYRVAGMETLNAGGFAKLASDYKAHGAGDEGLTTFWHAYAQFIIDAAPDDATAVDLLKAYLTDDLIKLAPSLKPSCGKEHELHVAKSTPPPATAAKSCAAPKLDTRLDQVGVHDELDELNPFANDLFTAEDLATSLDMPNVATAPVDDANASALSSTRPKKKAKHS